MCGASVCVDAHVCAQLLMQVWGCIFYFFSSFFSYSKRNANYWASGSVKCTAVVTVSARWTIELLYNLTVGGISRSHPRNHPVALPSSANVNQQVAFKAQGNKAITAFLYSNPFPHFTVCKAIKKRPCTLTWTEFKVSVS